ncbi:MAG: GAF domain-containing protein [Anaerolineales bacterium]
MSETTKPIYAQRHPLWSVVTTRLAPGLVVFFQLMALVALVISVINAFLYFRNPFIGSMVEHTLVLNASDSIHKGTWDAKAKGLGFGYQVLQINGKKISSVDEFNATLNSFTVGDQIELTVVNLLSADAQPEVVKITLQAYPVMDRIAQMLIPFIIGMVYLGSGLWVFSLRRYDITGQIFATFTASVAVLAGGLFEPGSTVQLTGLWTFCLAMGGGALVHLALLFPQEINLLRKYPFLGWLSYIIPVGLVIWAFPTLFNFSDPLAYVLAWRYEYVYLGLAIVFFVGVGIFRRFTATSPIARQQSQIILLGALISFLPIAIWFLITANRPEVTFSPFLLFPLALFPIAVAYAILRYRLLNTDYIFSRAVLYALLTIMAVTGYALLVSGFSLIFGSRITANNPFVIGFMVFILALLLNPLRVRLQTLIDRLFFRGQQAYRERANAFNQELNPALDLDSIIGLLRKYIVDTLMPDQLHIFIRDTLKDFYLPMPDEQGQLTTDIHFPSNAALPQVLSREKSAIFIRDDEGLLPALVSDRARLALLRAQLFVPLPGREQSILGFLALAPRKTGEPYNAHDLNLLKSFSDQAALALERAQVVDDLERRVTEMNVLIRVAQGVNITLRFDDILELIYAQTNRLIPARDFWIMLYDPENQLFQYAFYLEDDRRLLEHENRYIFADQELTQAVIRGGRPIITEDYERECRLRGLRPTVEGLYAWVGVPLNAGATTIGSLCLGSRDPSVIYSEEQVALLQAVADQAAGAIVKSRLLEESERSARQLSLLNEVGRNLTSVLDLPNLLEQILESAIDILNCEAGTLFLVEEETGELIFEVVKGPVAGELVGRRLPPGTGHVGRAVETGQPAIVNEVRTTSEWSDDEDHQTGFKTRDLLLVPMTVKDHVVGVIEVINRRDSMPFTQDDQDLLTTFTSQAAVAMENARLYTLTDQKLAARVDELSVMQRIDRDLNATLDVGRSMQITLDWAMRQSGADAGLVGFVEEAGIRVMADQGYASELESYRNSWLPLELPALKGAVETETTQQFRREDVLKSSNGFGLLEGTQEQIVIPIRREDDVIGVLMLETRRGDTWSDDSQAFLSRLTDHAAIAISNAQLFAQVQAADLAKTEFVSQVSHELKNPMTSMRGYTDLLISGAVGEVTDDQKNFLNIVRSNVTRMDTIVGDLADVSRIESGHLKLLFATVQIHDLVDEVARIQRRDIDEKAQTLDVQIPDDLPAVWGDRNRLMQILVNLVSNAYKYTPEGGTITIVAEHIPDQASEAGSTDMVRIAVKDTGYGMKPEDQKKIFTKFFRVEEMKASSIPGTGLGLNITRNLVEMQGGQIWFESQYGKGTSFYFTIPVAEV